MSEGPKFSDLVASGDPQAMQIEKIMNSDDYRTMNGSEHSAVARQIVSEYFSRTFGHAPAPGSRQRNTVGRGGLRG